MRFETPPGQQAQVDFGQARAWIADEPVAAHLLVCTLGYSRRHYVEGFPHERLSAVLAGHEHAFQHFGGVPAQIVVDNAKPVVLKHVAAEETRRHQVIWHPVGKRLAAAAAACESICPVKTTSARSSTDRMVVSEAAYPGSIPGGRTQGKIRQLAEIQHLTNKYPPTPAGILLNSIIVLNCTKMQF